MAASSSAFSLYTWATFRLATFLTLGISTLTVALKVSVLSVVGMKHCSSCLILSNSSLHWMVVEDLVVNCPSLTSVHLMAS